MITFLNAALLAGSAAILVPPIIHLLTRRKLDVVPWGAMQFLDLGRRARRRMIWDDLLLMAVRMAAIGVLALAFAAPAETAGWLAGLTGRAPRNIALVLDASASMAIGLPRDAAAAQALSLLDELQPDDRLAIIRAGPSPELILPLTADRDAARSALQSLQLSRGTCAAPAAVELARTTLAADLLHPGIVVAITDGQRNGWMDESAAQQWELQAPKPDSTSFNGTIMRLGVNRPAESPRWSLAPLRMSRALAIAGQPVVLHSELRRLGTGELQKPSLRFEIDGQPAGVIPLTGAAEQTSQRLELRHTFDSPGSHLATIRALDAGQSELDRQDLAFDVVRSLPVLIVDGDDRTEPRRHGVEFLREALAPARDPSPSVLVRVVPQSEFEPRSLARDINGPNSPPRVIVLMDVPRLTGPQSESIAQFLQAGGGVLVTLGDRADADFYTRQLHRGGQGWFPAAVGEQVGTGDPLQAPTPLVANLAHPALELFRQAGTGALSEARFPRRRSLSVPANSSAAVIARLTDKSSLFVEGAVGAGRVIVAAVPLDDSNRSNLVELPAFAPLMHELAAYLAGARAAESNLSPGQPMQVALSANEPQTGWSLMPPFGPAKPLAAENGRLVITDTHEPGRYIVQHTGQPSRYFAVKADPRENDLTPLSDDDCEKLIRWQPGLRWIDNMAEALAARGAPPVTRVEWIAFAVVLILFCLELWMTRQRALAA